MIFANAKKLQNGDEVIVRQTGEIIKVLCVRIESVGDGYAPYVLVKGIGEKSGYGEWQHTLVK